MLTAGDEFGRTQVGNNNAYAQDNAITWLDWEGRDRILEDYCAELARIRAAHPELSDPTLLTGVPGSDALPDVEWISPAGTPMAPADWEDPDARCFGMVLGHAAGDGRLAVLFNRGREAVPFALPAREGRGWDEAPVALAGRGVTFVEETTAGRRKPRRG
jgi:glycogen debranching enzyme